MPRSPRIEYPNAQYHIVAWGNQREAIVQDDEDRKIFVRTLAEARQKSGWEIFAWVLMDNHYHLAIRTPKANLVEGMKWFQNTFTRRINTRNQKRGHLFGDRYKAILVESPEYGNGKKWTNYLSTLVDYIHLNPARAGRVDGVQKSVMDYPWCSLARDYVRAEDQRTGWVEVDQGLRLVNLEDTVKGRRQYVERLDNCVIAEGLKAGLAENRDRSLQSHLQRGWYWGTKEFRENILNAFGQKVSQEENRSYQSSSLSQEHAVEQGEEIIRRACQYYGLKEEELLKPIRGDYRKTSVAWKIWQETTVSQRWTAERLKMKSPANVSQQVRTFARFPQKDLPDEVWKWKLLSRFGD